MRAQRGGAWIVLLLVILPVCAIQIVDLATLTSVDASDGLALRVLRSLVALLLLLAWAASLISEKRHALGSRRIAHVGWVMFIVWLGCTFI